MITKLFELRDSGTFMVIIATRFQARSEAERYLLGRSGFGVDDRMQSNYLFVANIQDHRTGSYDAFGHNAPGNDTRTLREAHLYLEKNFALLPTGSVIDIEFIKGERAEPKQSERFTTV